MNRKMTHTMRAELADAIRLRYRSATGKQKRRILDEFVASTGYHATADSIGSPITRSEHHGRPHRKVMGDCASGGPSGRHGVQHPDRRFLVIAGAGNGKTET